MSAERGGMSKLLALGGQVVMIFVGLSVSALSAGVPGLFLVCLREGG